MKWNKLFLNEMGYYLVTFTLCVLRSSPYILHSPSADLPRVLPPPLFSPRSFRFHPLQRKKSNSGNIGPISDLKEHPFHDNYRYHPYLFSWIIVHNLKSVSPLLDRYFVCSLPTIIIWSSPHPLHLLLVVIYLFIIIITASLPNHYPLSSLI